MIGTVGGILGWLISNGPSLIKLGVDGYDLGKQFLDQFAGRDSDSPVSKEEWRAFCNRALGDRAEIVAIIAAAEAELGA